MKLKSITIACLFVSALLAGGCTSARHDKQTAVVGRQPVKPTFHIDEENIPDVRPSVVGSFLLPPGDLPMSGVSAGDTAYVDRQIGMLMVRWQIPGCAVAIGRHGRLVFARAYGWSNVLRNEHAKPDSLCRVASVSKGITTAATLKLCQEKKLSLKARALSLLNYPPIPGVQKADPRLNRITIQELLEFSGGWNRDASADAMFVPDVAQAAEMLSPTLRPTPDVAIRYALTKQLDFDPGTDFAYSNLGYAILGRVIAKVAGDSYEDFARLKILAPMGIKGMRLGRTLVATPGEMTYYPYPGQEEARSIFPNYTRPVPLSYGGDFALEANQADGGWIASAPELVRFMCCLFGDCGKSPLSAKWLAGMIARPNLQHWQDTPEYFAQGFEVEETAGPLGRIVSRRGSFSGCMAYMGRAEDGSTIAYVVNTRPDGSAVFELQMLKAVWMAAHNTKFDETKDFFSRFD